MWTYRHKLQNEAYNAGKILPVDLRTSLRFEAEFERALEQRGRQAAHDKGIPYHMFLSSPAP